jgi:hypothetical protein
MAAREVLLQTVPRNAAYSFSVVSDQNRSGRPEDGYSMAPSSADLDSIGPEVRVAATPDAAAMLVHDNHMP